jgi:hypothetical protein
VKTSNTVKLAWTLFIIILLLSLGAESFMRPHSKFGIEGVRFFHAWFGFVSCLIIILFSKFIGMFLKRKTDYYREIADDE